MKQFVIIGNSAAGIACAEAIRKNDKESKIIIISDEDYTAYCRCLISYFLAGEVGDEGIVYRGSEFYKENNIELLLNKKVERVNPKSNRIVCEDKGQFSYDALLIATGAKPKFPNIPGIKKREVFGFRTIKDARDIGGLVPVTHTACILGGGLVGLKAAYALRKRNIDVRVIVKSKQILSQMLDYQAAVLLQKKLQENGVEIMLGVDASEIIGEEDMTAVKLDSGKIIGASLVVVGKGVEPNIDLVENTDIKIKEGVNVNEYMQTNIPNVYAAGDVCESFDLTVEGFAVNALWPVAVEQGRIAGLNMAGENIKYEGSVGMNSIEFFGLPTVSLGIYKTEALAEFKEFVQADIKLNLYKKLILRNNHLVGAVLVGDIKHSGLFLRLIKERIDVSTVKDKLLEQDFNFANIMDLVREKERIYV